MSLLKKRLLAPDTRQTLYNIIYKADTPSGWMFDVLLIVCILCSVVIVMLDSVAALHERWGSLFYGIEWAITLLFTAEYGLRIACHERPLKQYMTSFYGIIDLLAVIPTYASLFISGAYYMQVIRIVRILRIFKVLSLKNYQREFQDLNRAMFQARRKIFVFFMVVSTLVVVYGSLLYLIEGPEHGFTSIPRGIYWAIVTLTTVGYGDISPQTDLGQAIASLVMMTGFAIIAVPTGIITAAIHQTHGTSNKESRCARCGRTEHPETAVYCFACGGKL